MRVQPTWRQALGIGAALLLVALGSIFAARESDVVGAFAGEKGKYAVRSQLLTKAMDEVGVCDPRKAAETWANGVQTRSAALQYAVMTTQLKEQYAQRLESTAPNWVTGVSSPWIAGYDVIGCEVVSETCQNFQLSFSTESSAGPGESYDAVLVVVREGEFWRIQQIFTQQGLYPYTRF